MAKTLSFETGIVDYEINGVPVSFNPTDETFVSGLYATFGSLERLQTAFAEGDGFEKFTELDRDMRAQIDGLLGEGASDGLFPNMNCYALADGLPAWTNLFMALLYETVGAYEREFGKTDARVKAHRKKYDAMMAKYRKGKK